MSQLRLSNSDYLEPLIEDLRRRGDVVVGAIDDDTIEVSMLGSYGLESMRLAIYLHIRAWEAVQRSQGHDVHVDLI
jgi:hypothetical protein